MLELSDSTTGPLKALAGVAQVAHDEAVLPATLDCTRTTKVGWRGRTIMHSPKSAKILLELEADRGVGTLTNAQVHARQQ